MFSWRYRDASSNVIDTAHIPASPAVTRPRGAARNMAVECAAARWRILLYARRRFVSEVRGPVVRGYQYRSARSRRARLFWRRLRAVHVCMCSLPFHTGSAICAFRSARYSTIRRYMMPGSISASHAARTYSCRRSYPSVRVQTVGITLNREIFRLRASARDRS